MATVYSHPLHPCNREEKKRLEIGSTHSEIWPLAVQIGTGRDLYKLPWGCMRHLRCCSRHHYWTLDFRCYDSREDRQSSVVYSPYGHEIIAVSLIFKQFSQTHWIFRFVILKQCTTRTHALKINEKWQRCLNIRIWVDTSIMPLAYLACDASWCYRGFWWQLGHELYGIHSRRSSTVLILYAGGSVWYPGQGL